MKKFLKTDEWNIIEDSFQADRMRWSESIFSLGNGRFGQRGYFEEPYSSDSYRGTFVAGITFFRQDPRELVEKRFSTILYAYSQCSGMEPHQPAPHRRRIGLGPMGRGQL